ncbi:hypothetical protein [Tabrizicola sp.]|uniref:hypothetical protein n=1 Tax=Tabrizicola sp. TaxID=2005166 RepID=UPI003D270169
MVTTIEWFETHGTEAEKALIAACRVGGGHKANGGKLPQVGNTDAAVTVRADLIRLLAVQATSLHEQGVWLEGAVITGQLNLSFAKCRGRLVLDSCRFAEKPRIAHVELAELSLEGSHLPGLFAQGSVVRGSVFLRDVNAMGTVDLNAAQVGGQLSCTGAKLNGGKDEKGNRLKALNAQGAMVTGSVFLRGVTATGSLYVSGAQIGGQLDCEGATLNGDEDATGNPLRSLNAQGAVVTGDMFLTDVTAVGTVDVAGAQIGGQLACKGAMLNGGEGIALRAQSLRVQGFFFRKVRAVTGWVDLGSARVGDLVDDAASWDLCGDRVILDGFIYDQIGGNSAPKTFATRKNWLAKGSRFDGEFYPQPYTQFAKVMRAAGHAGEARKALIARDTILFQEAEQEDREALLAAYQYDVPTKADSGVIWLRLHSRRAWASLSRRVIGYGHRPEYAFFWALAAWGLGAVVYFLAYRCGLMVPNSDVIMVSQEWLNSVEANRVAPTAVWMGDTVGASAHYETFYSAIFALDKFLPLVDLGQESAWAITTTTNTGIALRWATFAYQIAGWVVTSLGIAAITGFVQRNAPD